MTPANKKSDIEYAIEDRGYETPCWIWQLAIGKLGYGNLWRNGTTHNAHRWYYQQARGRIAGGLQLDHLCRVRACVNPDHLEPVTNRENSHRGEKLKLSTHDVRAILCVRGITQARLAQLFGVGEAYIGKIRRGERRATA